MYILNTYQGLNITKKILLIIILIQIIFINKKITMEKTKNFLIFSKMTENPKYIFNNIYPNKQCINLNSIYILEFINNHCNILSKTEFNTFYQNRINSLLYFNNHLIQKFLEFHSKQQDNQDLKKEILPFLINNQWDINEKNKNNQKILTNILNHLEKNILYSKIYEDNILEKNEYCVVITYTKILQKSLEQHEELNNLFKNFIQKNKNQKDYFLLNEQSYKEIFNTITTKIIELNEEISKDNATKITELNKNTELNKKFVESNIFNFLQNFFTAIIFEFQSMEQGNIYYNIFKKIYDFIQEELKDQLIYNLNDQEILFIYLKFIKNYDINLMRIFNYFSNQLMEKAINFFIQNFEKTEFIIEDSITKEKKYVKYNIKDVIKNHKNHHINISYFIEFFKNKSYEGHIFEKDHDNKLFNSLYILSYCSYDNLVSNSLTNDLVKLKSLVLCNKFITELFFCIDILDFYKL